MSKKNSKPDSIKFKHCKMCTNVAIVNHKTIIFEKKKTNKIKINVKQENLNQRLNDINV